MVKSLTFMLNLKLAFESTSYNINSYLLYIFSWKAPRKSFLSGQDLYIHMQKLQ